MSQHTPAPWTVNGPSKPDNTGGRDYCVVDMDDKIIAECFEHVGRLPDNTYDTRPAYDNARLIAAAPDLLDALKLAIPLMVGALAFVDCKAQLQTAREAIAKATAVQP